MPGRRGSRNEAREQLVPKDCGDVTSSSSPSHSFPQYDLPLPGTLPPVQPSVDGPTPAQTTNTVSNGGLSYQELATASYIAAPGAPPGAEMEPGMGPQMAPAAATPQPAAAALLQSPPSSRAPGGQGGAAPSTGGSSVVAAMEIQEALLPPQPPPAFEHPIPLSQRRWMVAMFCLVAALLFADQNLLAPNLTAAASYFGMTDDQKDTLLGGALMAAFFAVGAPAALLVGWLTDRGNINRRTLLFWVVVVGETPCLLTYWVRSYWQFFLLRALTGVAVGGCFPLVFSLLGDLFPPRRRAAVSAVVQISTGLGLAVGQALSGSIGPATNWRVPFVVVAAPSLAVAVIMLATTQEPPRGAYEEALRERFAEGLGSYEGRISWGKVAVLLRCPSNALVICQGLPGSLPWGMVQTYFNDFLSQQKGFTVQTATVVLLMFGAGGAVGVIGGGAGGQWLYNRRKEYQALLAGGCVLAGIGPLYALINADLQRMGLAASCVLAALGGAVASVAGPNLRSVMLNVNEPETRGVALALQAMTDDLGKGLGPVLVAGLIRALGREGAFNVATAGWVPCGVMLACLACCMRRDEAAMQARLARASEKQAAAAEAAAAAAAGGGGALGGGVAVPMSPSPSVDVDGDGTGAGATPANGTSRVGLPGGASAGVDAAASARREEKRLAKMRLLGEPGLRAPGSSELLSSEREKGLENAATTPVVAVPGRGEGFATGEGGKGGGGSCRLPLSSSASEIVADPGARTWVAAGPRPPGAAGSSPLQPQHLAAGDGAARTLYDGYGAGGGSEARTSQVATTSRTGSPSVHPAAGDGQMQPAGAAAVSAAWQHSLGGTPYPYSTLPLHHHQQLQQQQQQQQHPNNANSQQLQPSQPPQQQQQAYSAAPWLQQSTPSPSNADANPDPGDVVPGAGTRVSPHHPHAAEVAGPGGVTAAHPPQLQQGGEGRGLFGQVVAGRLTPAAVGPVHGSGPPRPELGGGRGGGWAGAGTAVPTGPVQAAGSTSVFTLLDDGEGEEGVGGFSSNSMAGGAASGVRRSG